MESQLASRLGFITTYDVCKRTDTSTRLLPRENDAQSEWKQNGNK